MRYPINTHGSSSIDTLSVNPITGSVRVCFLKTPGRQYRFKASRRAILWLLWDSDCSLGHWVSRRCL